MATQRPGGVRPPKPTTPTTPTTQATPAATSTSRAGKPHAATPRQSDAWSDLGADTAIWHTRGLQSNTRMRAPMPRRTPPRQLPPSQVPRLMLWAMLIGVALVCFQAVRHML